jgi:Glycosyl transferases group 1
MSEISRKNTRKVTLIGGVPEPIGGITNFLFRLIQSKPSKFLKIIDPYVGAVKQSVPIPHIRLRIGILGLLLESFRISNESVIFNFSSWRSLIFLAILPRRSNHWSLILYHGKMKKSIWQILLKPILKIALNKFSTVGVLSDEQFDFYEKYGGKELAKIPLSFYLPCKSPVLTDDLSLVLNRILNWKLEGVRVFLSSGYPTLIYQHEKIIDSFKRLQGEKIALALFLYGEDSDGILNRIKKNIVGVDNIFIYWAQPESVFMAALSMANGYIRMNTVDSFGVAVADAVNLGVPVIATNVCPRYPGAICISPDDDESLRDFILGRPIEGEVNPTSSRVSYDIYQFIDLFLDKKEILK